MELITSPSFLLIQTPTRTVHRNVSFFKNEESDAEVVQQSEPAEAPLRRSERTPKPKDWGPDFITY